ncbi:Glutathione S-transferase theta-1 [Trichoplax sp. H2]|nr:Glutathione S-transferase theta-1 [Trichoplax sp. H2]|eukprot:RDD42400.1 Glutathione S-transferase theta-1 [Trichoplax sp. H2]
MASNLIYYYDAISQPCRSVLMFLNANKISYEGRVLSLFSGAYRKSDELAAINPQRYLPVIKDSQVQLFESDAILKYVADQYKVSDHWYPADLAKRARINEYMSWHHSNTRSSCIGLFRLAYLGPRFFNKKVDEKERQDAVDKLNKTADFIESYFLKDSEYINSNSISIADLLAVCEFSQLIIVDYDVAQGRPKVAKWVQNIKSNLGSIYEDAHEIVYQFQKEVQEAKKA